MVTENIIGNKKRIAMKLLASKMLLIIKWSYLHNTTLRSYIDPKELK